MVHFILLIKDHNLGTKYWYHTGLVWYSMHMHSVLKQISNHFSHILSWYTLVWISIPWRILVWDSMGWWVQDVY